MILHNLVLVILSWVNRLLRSGFKSTVKKKKKKEKSWAKDKFYFRAGFRLLSSWTVFWHTNTLTDKSLFVFNKEIIRIRQTKTIKAIKNASLFKVQLTHNSANPLSHLHKNESFTYHRVLFAFYGCFLVRQSQTLEK